ncbi:stage V sporulation protein AE [Pontibacillus yanchengensis]|uniref:Stage V sporulation protein AE n=2 Tax=Pontibacillus yanchengensis TaxID=462910 RepID=A0ACC7VK48_9BACI|nr:stage V sporulation protein AE [Pontibacillus yanchengensis]MYL32678.1 stage V sporulation protein AE [Pontibacillus yanchengensis]MYL55072.1 stage V sporulation protein AE [Pontibacillus yanchengensis]
MHAKKVIVVTDGDEYARKVLLSLSETIGGTCLAHLSANPTTATEQEILAAIKSAKSEPVYVLFDDAGIPGMGPGEKLLEQIANNKSVHIIGAIAVASHTKFREWSRFDFAIDGEGELVPFGVDKEGIPEMEMGRISGDTVYCLDQLSIPTIVAIGDIGKMRGKDDIEKGAPITRKAIELILERAEENEISE